MALSQDSHGSTTEPDTPSGTLLAPRFVFAYLVPLSQVARLAVERTRRSSVYHSKFITSIEYRGDASTPCFEIALGQLPDFPRRGWFIGSGRLDQPNEGVDFLLGTDGPEDSIAGIHGRFSWDKTTGGFFLIGNNHRKKYCTVNGVDLSSFGDKRPVPVNNTILVGEYPFTLQYVSRDPPDDDLFQIELKAFMLRFLDDINPLVLPTPREQSRSFGEWDVQYPLERGAFGIVYMVIHRVHGKHAAAKQLLETHSNSSSIQHEVQMARHISKLSHKGIASPFEVLQARIGRDNITDEFIVVSPLLPVNLHAMIKSSTWSELNRAICFAKILDAVNFLHTNGFFHRDIKPASILIQSDDPPLPKITDFGSALPVCKSLYDKPGSTTYLAPEQVEGACHGPPVDLWACALIGRELLMMEETQNRVLPGPRLDGLRDELEGLVFTEKLVPFCCKHMLNPNPEERMTAGVAFEVLRLSGGAALRDAISEVGIDDTRDSPARSSKRARTK